MLVEGTHQEYGVGNPGLTAIRGVTTSRFKRIRRGLVKRIREGRGAVV